MCGRIKRGKQEKGFTLMAISKSKAGWERSKALGIEVKILFMGC